jgi:hypothetical protein
MHPGGHRYFTYSPRQSVAHIREVDYFILLAWEFDFTHVNDQHTKLMIISCK